MTAIPRFTILGSMTTAEYTGLQKLILGIRDEFRDEFKGIYRRLDKIDSRLDGIDRRFDENEIIQNEILNAIGKKHDEFEQTDADHERRISRLERRAA